MLGQGCLPRWHLPRGLRPGSTCSKATACPGSLVTYSLAPRTGSFARPGVKDGTITIFTEPSGDVVVTVSLDCNCYISVVGANGNTVNLGPEGSCPANMNGFTDPTLTSATSAPALLTCMSWVLPKARVDAALAASATPGAVVITSHFAVSCYSDCSTVSGAATATQVLSSGPAEDVRCDLAPFRGVVYRPVPCYPELEIPIPEPPVEVFAAIEVRAAVWSCSALSLLLAPRAFAVSPAVTAQAGFCLKALGRTEAHARMPSHFGQELGSAQKTWPRRLTGNTCSTVPPCSIAEASLLCRRSFLCPMTTTRQHRRRRRRRQMPLPCRYPWMSWRQSCR